MMKGNGNSKGNSSGQGACAVRSSFTIHHFWFIIVVQHLRDSQEVYHG